MPLPDDKRLVATSFERLVYLTMIGNEKQIAKAQVADIRLLRKRFSGSTELVPAIRAVAPEIYCQLWPTWPSAFLCFTGSRKLDFVNAKCEHVFGRCVCPVCKGKGQNVMAEVLTELRGRLATLKANAVAARC